MNIESTREKWLIEGYGQFAEFGPDNLSINNISKVLDSSRASFYHYFGDISMFIDELLSYHWTICKDFNEYGKITCKRLIPDLYDELGKYTLPLKFSLQLFHHRNIPAYNYLFLKSYGATADAFALNLFADHLNINPDKEEVRNLWLTLGEAWYSRLDPDDLSPETLMSHSMEIIESVQKLIRSDLYEVLK
ncbi:TetR/AcrR family transcriptional regulator [Fulvivirga sedimenti]|uniref:TetR/AcrR family transcriptional regulator n=1 Tax=Fulvivirga sedimenti TaxID=2879465 RepID=A0A9X1HVE4_9BACT|nr:TetR/AcrR family transcriptional regulator [Fulvivirga sedimenti]MCA6078371.1 TetR/AcrR family transcriptional regulator [Fulvivirga sedimenti]